MIDYYDFVPKVIDKGGLFRGADIESLRKTVDDANVWIDANKIDVVNIETIVLPNMHAQREEGSEDTNLRSSGDHFTNWSQFVRVWYRR